MMKILMTTMSLDIGGAETHILELSRELVQRGIEVAVASNGGVYVPQLEEAGIRHYSVPLNTKNPWAVLTSYFRLRRIIKREKFDVVHAHARIPAFIWLPCRNGKRPGVRILRLLIWILRPRRN